MEIVSKSVNQNKQKKVNQMRNFTVVLEVTKFGTEDERITVEYDVSARDKEQAKFRAVDAAANDGHYVDEYELLHINEC